MRDRTAGVFRRIRQAAVVLTLAFQAAAARGAEQDPGVEFYGLTGAYFHGNSGSEEWRPQFGAGIMAPLNRNWRVFLDVTTSATEEHWTPSGSPDPVLEDNLLQRRRLVLTPSVARFWRIGRVSLYVGSGMAFEHRQQSGRIRPIIAFDENGRPIFADAFQDVASSDTLTLLPTLRTGAILDVNPNFTIRAGYSYLRRYTDTQPSRSVELGAGYRF